MIYMYFKKTNKKQPISAHLKLHMGQTKSGLAAQINPLFKKCRCDGPHSQHLAHQALHPSRHYTHLKSTPMKLWYTFRFQCVGVHIHKPSTNLAQKHYPSRPKNRPRDFDSIISGGLDHLRACCTTLRWYLSLVVDASWVLARRDDLFCFFLDEMAKNAHFLLVLVNEPRSSIKGADGNLYLGKWDRKHTAHGRKFRKSFGWTSGLFGEFWSLYKTELSVTNNDITWRHESMSSHKCCLNSVLKKKHHSYNKSSSFGEEEVLAIVAVWAVDAWCWWSVPGEHDAVFVFRGASILGMSLTILRLFRLHQNVGF